MCLFFLDQTKVIIPFEKPPPPPSKLVYSKLYTNYYTLYSLKGFMLFIQWRCNNFVFYSLIEIFTFLSLILFFYSSEITLSCFSIIHLMVNLFTCKVTGYISKIVIIINCYGIQSFTPTVTILFLVSILKYFLADTNQWQQHSNIFHNFFGVPCSKFPSNVSHNDRTSASKKTKQNRVSPLWYIILF